MALSFSGGSHRVNIGSGSTLDNLATGTVLMLVYADDITTFAYLVYKITGIAGWEFHKRAVDPASLRFALSKGGAQASIISTSFLTASTWIWVAVTWNVNGSGAMTGKIWSAPLDGVFTDRTSSVSGGSGSQDSDAAADCIIGNTAAAGSGWLGDIASVRIFNADLADAATLAAARRVVLSSMVSRYELGLFGSSATDYGYGQNTGTITGATVAPHPYYVVPWIGRGPAPNSSTAAAGRTTRNTRSHPLGLRAGIAWRVA